MRDLCEVFDIQLSEARTVSIEEMDAHALEALIDHLKRERRWPD